MHTVPRAVQKYRKNKRSNYWDRKFDKERKEREESSKDIWQYNFWTVKNKSKTY